MSNYSAEVVNVPRVSHEWVTVDNDVIHLLDFGGPGQPVLFLHGVGGSAWTWAPVADQLHGAVRMIAVDLPGWGESRWRADFDYTSHSLAAPLADVVAAITPDPIDVVGFSWGGLIGLALAAQAPAAVRRLAMIDIPPATPLSDTDIPQLPTTFPDLEAAVAASRALAPRATEQVLRRDAAHGVRPTPGGGYQKKIDPRLVQRWPFRNDNLWPELAAFTGELLIVRAEQSQTLNAEVAAQMATTAHSATLHTIPDSGHLIPLERPAELAGTLRSFLQA
ncbi:MAG TPA: alpha/beta hydrolase [Micromonosporaceae bacterium]|nr:alpha/beta hydrolase [Micromonosporaceae bacterium]